MPPQNSTDVFVAAGLSGSWSRASTEMPMETTRTGSGYTYRQGIQDTRTDTGNIYTMATTRTGSGYTYRQGIQTQGIYTTAMCAFSILVKRYFLTSVKFMTWTENISVLQSFQHRINITRNFKIRKALLLFTNQH